MNDQEWDYGALAIEVSAAKAEIERLKALLVRAADALEEMLPLVHQTWNPKASARSKLIDELRKAGE